MNFLVFFVYNFFLGIFLNPYQEIWDQLKFVAFLMPHFNFVENLESHNSIFCKFLIQMLKTKTFLKF
jgi:hypothetical protein